MGIDVLDNVQVDEFVDFGVSLTHPSYDEFLPVWEKNRDAHAGEEAIKAKGTKYLPQLNGQTKGEYDSYKRRAQFFGATNRTVESYLGMVFRKDPIYMYTSNGEESQEIADYFKEAFKTITYDGKSFNTLIHNIVEEIIITNRVGVLVDMPPLDPVEAQNMTLEEYEQRKIKPMASLYKAESIINWYVEIIDNQLLPVLFVLRETKKVFAKKSLQMYDADVYRILYLENWEDKELRRYKSIKIEQQFTDTGLPLSNTVPGRLKVTEISYPMIDGEYFKHIPFYIMTDRGLDYMKMYYPMINDLTNTNIGHYMNSADWENELHWVGVKTLYFPDWDKAVYGEPRIGGAMAGPANTVPVLLEPKSDSGIKEEMILKEGRMSILGAERISQKGRYIPSAETARITAASEASVLTNMVNHLSKSLSTIADVIIRWMRPALVQFDGELACTVIVNNDFYQDDMSGAELVNWMSALQQGGVSFDTYFYNLQKKEVFPPGWTKDREWASIEKTAGLLMRDPDVNELVNDSLLFNNPLIDSDGDGINDLEMRSQSTKPVRPGHQSEKSKSKLG